VFDLDGMLIDSLYQYVLVARLLATWSCNLLGALGAPGTARTRRLVGGCPPLWMEAHPHSRSAELASPPTFRAYSLAQKSPLGSRFRGHQDIPIWCPQRLHLGLSPNGISSTLRAKSEAMSTETRMAIEQSTPMPQRSEGRASVRYETKVFSHWDRQALAEVDAAFTYEIAWIPERQCWRSFLCSVSKLA